MAAGLTRGPGPPVCRLCVTVIRDFHLFTAHWLLVFYLRVTGEAGVTTTIR